MADCYLCGEKILEELLTSKNLFILVGDKFFVCWSCINNCVECEIVIQRKLKETI